MASYSKTHASFEKDMVKIQAKAEKPSLIVFSVNYRWDEESEDKINDWDFILNIIDEGGELLHSDYRHFEEEEPGLLTKDEEGYKEYIKEEAYLKHYKCDVHLECGEGLMARSIKTPTKKGTYLYACHITSQFWARRLGEDKGLAKNLTESTAECIVRVDVS